MHGRHRAPVPFTYNWPTQWPVARQSIAIGDDRWQYDNIWRPFLNSLNAPHYRRPELDFNTSRLVTAGRSSPDLKADYEGYGNRARYVLSTTFAPVTGATIGTAPFIDRYTGLMLVHLANFHPVAANNNFATILNDVLNLNWSGYDDWLPMTYSVYMTMFAFDLLSSNPFPPLGGALATWLATAGNTSGIALITTGIAQFSTQAITGGTARNIFIYRKHF